MTVDQLIEKLTKFKTSGHGHFNVKVLESVSGDLTEINSVNFALQNGGEIHIAVELEYEEYED